jgi:hypothetical protein
LGASRLLPAVGLTIWLGALLTATTYVSRRMRFPKAMYARGFSGSVTTLRTIAGLILFAVAAVSAPTVALVFTMFATGLVAYGMGAYLIALKVERRRATRLGAPEPGTAGIFSVAESAVFLAMAVPCAVTALALTVYGIASELGGNRGEGAAGLGLGAAAWLMTFFMALFASPLLLLRWRR